MGNAMTRGPLVIRALEEAIGEDRVRSHPLDLAIFDKDAGVERGAPMCVVFPESTEHVSAIVRIAASHGVPIVPRGAGTGLAGGAIATEPGVLVVMTKLHEIEIDAEARTAWVGPGVINLDLSRHVEDLGLHFAPDPSSQQACTIGGNVGTNAGGPHGLADGSTVAHVLAAEVVLADGSIVTVGGEYPDPIGLDLRAVVVGSEGTLGIVTRVLVKLTQNPPHVDTLLLGFDDIENAARTVSDTIASGIVPAALEMMDREMIVAVERFARAGYPVEAAAVLLVELTGTPQEVDAAADAVATIAEARDAFVIRRAENDAERALLWKGRKAAFGAVAQTAPDYYLHDTVVPRTKLVEVLNEIYEIAGRYGLTMMNVFHAGDGNLHPLIAFDASEPGMLDKVRESGEEMVEVSVRAGGSLSGEHGIGVEKRDLMGRVFTDLDLDAQARVREAFDPDASFNPGKVLPTGARCFDASGRRLP